MCASLDRARATLLLHVARLYWQEGLSQDDIAARTRYSRATVSRMLAEARKVGIVTVTVAHPVERLMNLEKQLISAFGLSQARVAEDVESPTEPAAPEAEPTSGGVSRALARAAGELLVANCGPRSVVAVSNGQAVGAVAHELPERTWSASTTVAMLGSAGDVLGNEDGPDICRNIALRLGGHVRTLPVPLVFDSARIAQAVRDEDQILATLELAARSDVALTGIGAVGPQGQGVSPLLRRWMTPAVVRECRERGAVAHVVGHHLDARGRHVRTSICERTLCLDPARLREIPLVIGVAAGSHKAAAILAALRGGYLSALVTDETTAQAVLTLAGARD